MAALLSDHVKYCIRCGSLLTQAMRSGRLRPVCPACEWVYFADPKVAVAALIEHEGRILLGRRANDPRRGLWTLPAGFIDAGEDPERAIVRECQEETGLMVHILRLVDVLYGQEHPRGAHILIAYQVGILSGELQPGDDIDRVDYFSPQELPPLAFETTGKILRLLNRDK